LIPPPETDPYIGHFLVEIPLGADINGNGENDKIKFTLASHSAGDENRTFIVLPDGTVIEGVEVFQRLYSAVGLGWLAAPSRWRWLRPVFDAAYRWFARNRLRLTGRADACDSQACLPSDRTSA